MDPVTRTEQVAMGTELRTVTELVRKWSVDSWQDVAHLSDAQLVEYLFRIGDASFRHITRLIPDDRLAALAPNLNALLAASPKGTWLHRRFNHSNEERAEHIRRAVATTCSLLSAAQAFDKTAPGAPPCDPPSPIGGSGTTVAGEPEALAIERQRLQCEREALRHEIELLKQLREANGRECLRAQREFQRRVVAGVLALVFVAVAAFLAGSGLNVGPLSARVGSGR